VLHGVTGTNPVEHPIIFPHSVYSIFIQQHLHSSTLSYKSQRKILSASHDLSMSLSSKLKIDCRTLPPYSRLEYSTTISLILVPFSITQFFVSLSLVERTLCRQPQGSQLLVL